MLKRIFIIGLFTGFGQLYSIFVLKHISAINSVSESTEIAQLDSLFFFILSAIAFGLQPAAIRDLAISRNWKQEYHEIQSARLAFSILLMSVVIAALFNKYYLIFLLAPIIALSGEYALYARGAPVFGSFMSFLRLTIPFSSILVAVYFFPGYTGLAYAVSLLIIYLITNLLISRYLDVPVFFRPSFKNLRYYVDSIPLGLVTISQYVIGLGLMLIAPYFYESGVLAIVFAGLKFYVLYKGVLRIIHQAFVQDMRNEAFCLKVDQLSIMIGFLFLLSAFFFPESFIALFFGQQALTEKVFFQLLAISAILYSFCLSMGTTALLLKKDRSYSIVSVVAAGIAIVSSILLSFSYDSAIALGLSLCLGEFTWMFGLILISPGKKKVEKRLLFLVEIIFIAIVPFLASYFLGDTKPCYFVTVGAVSLILLLLHYKKFRL